MDSNCKKCDGSGKFVYDDNFKKVCAYKNGMDYRKIGRGVISCLYCSGTGDKSKQSDYHKYMLKLDKIREGMHKSDFQLVLKKLKQISGKMTKKCRNCLYNYTVGDFCILCQSNLFLEQKNDLGYKILC